MSVFVVNFDILPWNSAKCSYVPKENYSWSFVDMLWLSYCSSCCCSFRAFFTWLSNKTSNQGQQTLLYFFFSNCSELGETLSEVWQAMIVYLDIILVCFVVVKVVNNSINCWYQDSSTNTNIYLKDFKWTLQLTLKTKKKSFIHFHTLTFSNGWMQHNVDLDTP